MESSLREMFEYGELVGLFWDLFPLSHAGSDSCSEGTTFGGMHIVLLSPGMTNFTQGSVCLSALI